MKDTFYILRRHIKGKLSEEFYDYYCNARRDVGPSYWTKPMALPPQELTGALVNPLPQRVVHCWIAHSVQGGKHEVRAVLYAVTRAR